MENNCTAASPLSLGGWLEQYLSSGLYYNQEENFLDADPGQVAEYSNVGAGFVGYILELATGTALAQYAKQAVFDPLGMDNSSFRLSDLNKGNVAKPYFPLGEDVVGLPFTTWPPWPMVASKAVPTTWLGYGSNHEQRNIESDRERRRKGSSAPSTHRLLKRCSALAMEETSVYSGLLMTFHLKVALVALLDIRVATARSGQLFVH